MKLDFKYDECGCIHRAKFKDKEISHFHLVAFVLFQIADSHLKSGEEFKNKFEIMKYFEVTDPHEQLEFLEQLQEIYENYDYLDFYRVTRLFCKDNIRWIKKDLAKEQKAKAKLEAKEKAKTERAKARELAKQKKTQKANI